MATAVSGYNSGHNAVHGNNGSAMMMATGTSEMGTNGGGAHVAVPKRIGEMRLRLWYNIEEVLPLAEYQQLHLALVKSLGTTPYSASLISIMQHLTIDIEAIARPLMKIFMHSNQIRTFFRLICSQYIGSCCHDINTLFRSQSLASKVMYEMMKFAGAQYLTEALKPLIDLIFAERRCCEIDPSRLKSGHSLEANFRNLTVYAELAFSRVVDSRHRCPQVLREVFAELRCVVQQFFPGRQDIARLALSSFVIMRFFAAAILNPRLFALKRESPDTDVSRTLVLVSKILQRLANCVVSARPLTTKEQWLSPVLARFSDEPHKQSMIRFLDAVSCSARRASASAATHSSTAATTTKPLHVAAVGKSSSTSASGKFPPSAVDSVDLLGDGGGGSAESSSLSSSQSSSVSSSSSSSGDEPVNGEQHAQQIDAMNNDEFAVDESIFPPTPPASTVLKQGFLVERRSCGFDKKRSFKTFLQNQKRRYVVLTEQQLSWQKLSANSNTPNGKVHCTEETCTTAPGPSAFTTVGQNGHTFHQHTVSFHGAGARHNGGGQLKGHFSLVEITSISALSDVKHAFRITTLTNEVVWQAANIQEMNEWMILIQKQQRRNLMQLNRPAVPSPATPSAFGYCHPYNSPPINNNGSPEIDLEYELATLHSHLVPHMETLLAWNNEIEALYGLSAANGETDGNGEKVGGGGGHLPLSISTKALLSNAASTKRCSVATIDSQTTAATSVTRGGASAPPPLDLTRLLGFNPNTATMNAENGEQKMEQFATTTTTEQQQQQRSAATADEQREQKISEFLSSNETRAAVSVLHDTISSTLEAISRVEEALALARFRRDSTPLQQHKQRFQ